MPARKVLAALPVFLAVPVLAQPALYGVRANGDLLKINTTSGAGVFVGSSGVECRGACAVDVPVNQGPAPQVVETAGPANQLFWVYPWSGHVFNPSTLANVPVGYSIHGIAPGYVILSQDNPSGIDLLASTDSSGIVIIGPTGRTDLESLAVGPGGLFALGTSGGGSLCQVNTSTGAATVIGGGGFGDARALAWLPIPYFTLVACGSDLLRVDVGTGGTTLIGPTGFSDIRGLAFVRACVADCSPGGVPPLNVLDFGCFLNQFAAGSPYANCDGSTTEPVLNVLDFVCFLNAFASGCQ